MKIVVIGATGTIGKGIVRLLQPQHEIVPVGHSGSEFRVDMGSKDSIASLFQEVGTVEAIISAAGLARFGKLADLSDEDFLLGLHHKLVSISRQNASARGMRRICRARLSISLDGMDRPEASGARRVSSTGEFSDCGVGGTVGWIVPETVSIKKKRMGVLPGSGQPASWSSAPPHK
jgi:hypothetical protein